MAFSCDDLQWLAVEHGFGEQLPQFSVLTAADVGFFRDEAVGLFGGAPGIPVAVSRA